MTDIGSMLSNQPVVIDNGTGYIKAGFAGSDAPASVFQSYVGRPKHMRVMVQTKLDDDVFVGRVAEEHRGVLSLAYAMEHGRVTNWDDMERLWSYIYTKECLGTSSEDHPVLLTEAPLNPRKNREKAAEIFFETFNAPALFTAPQATLSLYASGRTTGVVLDIGAGVSHVCPVYEGFSMPNAVSRIDVAGRDVTNHMMRLLRKSGHVFHTSAEREVVRTIKEECCYVAFNPSKEEKMEADRHNTAQTYKLPDGRVIEIGGERFRAPECLFQPSILGTEYPGVHECLFTSIMKCDLDVRRTLFSQIVLAGGSTLFPGFGDRLLNELRKNCQRSNAGSVKIRISASPNRKFLTYIGGSILASLATFKEMWVSKEAYAEHGASLIHRRTI